MHAVVNVACLSTSGCAGALWPHEYMRPLRTRVEEEEERGRGEGVRRGVSHLPSQHQEDPAVHSPINKGMIRFQSHRM